MFATRLESFGDAVAAIDSEQGAVSYQALAAQADALYAGMISGTLVAVECRNDIATLAAYLGALRARCPVLLLDAQLPEDLRQALYGRYGIARVWSVQHGWQGLGSCAAVPVHPELALLLSTSGSTASPKLVRLGHVGLQANATSIAGFLALGPEDRPITTLPMHYSYGLSVINSHLSVGATVLLTAEPVTSKAFWLFFREHLATSLAGVPTTYVILRQLRFERMSLPSLRALTQAGGRLPVEQVRWMAALARERAWQFTVMYGQTEATARMAYLSSERVLDKPDAIGVAIPGGRLMLQDMDGALISEPRQTGELVYQGPNVMLGYAHTQEDLQLGDVQQGILHTGDLAWCDEDGCFHITGRLARFIKIHGNRIGLDDIEAQLNAVGYPVAITGQDETLMIALLQDIDEAALVQHLFSRYRIHKTAVRLMRVQALPLSSAGKVQYAQLRDLFVTQAGATPS